MCNQTNLGTLKLIVFESWPGKEKEKGRDKEREEGGL